MSDQDINKQHQPTFFRNINCVPSLGKTAKGLLIHFIVTLIFSLIIYFYYRDFLLCLFSIAFGFFLDADHLVDYSLYLLKFKKNFDLKEFLSGTYFADWKKFITPLHNYELAIILILIYLIIDKTSWISRYSIVVSISLIQHFIIDYMVNYVRPVAYSFIFRAKNNFIKSTIRA